MSDMKDLLYPEDPATPKDAYVSVRAAMAKPQPKRFYTEVSLEAVDGGFAILLDGKRARTPGRALLALRTRVAAEQVAAEWAAQERVIDPANMHATRIANVGIDRIGAVREEVLDDIARYAASDLVCYRAEGPDGLVARENAAWTPILDHVKARYGAPFVLAAGIGFQRQPETAIAAVRAAFARIGDPVALAGAQTLVTLAGSALIPLALIDGALAAEVAFDATSVEEDWNTHLWGEDSEAAHRRARRRAEFLAAAGLFRALAA